MFYLVVFFILFIFSVLEISNLNRVSHKILIGISWLMLVLIAGLRYETGGDWEVYTPIFEQTNPIFSVLSGDGFGVSKMEVGYLLFCSIIKQLGGGIQTVFFLIVLFNITLITKSLKAYTKYIVVGLFVYYGMLYFLLEMLYTRQSVAVAICFYAMTFVKRENFWKYFFLVLIASSFHKMAIVMIPMYFLLKYRLSNLLMITVISVGSVLMFFHVEWISNIFVGISSFFGDEVKKQAVFYITENTFAVSRSISIGFFLNLMIFAAVMLCRKRIEENKMGTVFINLFFASLLVYYYMYELIEVSNRFRYMLLISVIVLFPYFIQAFEKYFNKITILIAIAAYSFMFSAAVFLGRENAVAYNPYQNYIIYKYLDQKSTGEKRLQKSKKATDKQREEMNQKQQ